jgi:hypothetical protein
MLIELADLVSARGLGPSQKGEKSQDTDEQEFHHAPFN